MFFICINLTENYKLKSNYEKKIYRRNVKENIPHSKSINMNINNSYILIIISDKQKKNKT